MNYELKNTLLCLDKVCVNYGNKVILKDISLIEKDVITSDRNTGQCIAIVGDSGRGKSTLFKALTGLIKPTSGRILIPSKEDILVPRDISEGDVGFVNQTYTLFRHKTIFQSLMYSLRKTKLSDKEKKDRILEELDHWRLLPQKNQYPNELSGGQRQRTAILEQVLTSNRYIVFDEPASGLSVTNIEKLKDCFDLISRQDSLNTVIFSTHDLNLAVNLADSIYVIGHKNPEDDFSQIVAHYDLKTMGLAWEKFGNDHLELSRQIRQDIINS